MSLMQDIARRISSRPQLRVETLALLLSLWFTATCNPLFWGAALAGHDVLQMRITGYAIALAVLLSATHFVLLTLLATLLPRSLIRLVFALLTATTALTAYYMQSFHVYVDVAMVRNVLSTDIREASELFSWSMLPPLLAWMLPPLLLIARTRLRLASGGSRFARSAGYRLASLTLGVVAAALALLAGYQDLSSLMRTHKEARYLITPANVLYGLAANAPNTASVEAATGRLKVGTDAVFAPNRPGDRPVLVLVVVGETARAANWGLSGYARQTTPRLAALDVLNFVGVTACGTSTEVSLPCMLSALGRRNYDESLIRQSEALPHVLDHAGLRVAWLDNQSGCKETCDGLELWKPQARDCSAEGCRDETLLAGARRLTEGRADDTVLFLHMLGNHGPAYSRRYPDEFRQFAPACETTDLAQCTREEITNAYDNALLYTDHVLAEAIAWLTQMQDSHDTALVYVSDHGESLGEKGLYLHGFPYAIAPDEQKQVPMVMWLSSAYAERFALDTACLRTRAAQPATHDNLFHTVLGLLDVRTRAREPDLDLTAGCAAG